MWPNIARCLGLHQSIDIIYVVDGYDAIMWDCDGAFNVAEGHGDDVQSAMDALDTALAGADLRGRLWRSYVDTLYSTGQLDTWVGFDRPVSEVTP